MDAPIVPPLSALDSCLPKRLYGLRCWEKAEDGEDRNRGNENARTGNGPSSTPIGIRASVDCAVAGGVHPWRDYADGSVTIAMRAVQQP